MWCADADIDVAADADHVAAALRHNKNENENNKVSSVVDRRWSAVGGRWRLVVTVALCQWPPGATGCASLT